MLENWGTVVIALFGVMFILMGGALAVFVWEAIDLMKAEKENNGR